MFKYVNELSNDIEVLERGIEDLKTEKKKYEGKGTNVDQARKETLKSLENKHKRAETQSDKYEFEYHDALKIISSLTVTFIG